MTHKPSHRHLLGVMPALPALLLLQLHTGPVLAQQNDQTNPRREQLKACMQNLTIKVSQAEQLQRVMQQTLEPRQKLRAVGELLTPQQREELRTCMRQSMPTTSAAPTP